MSAAVDVANAAHFDHNRSASSLWTTHSVTQAVDPSSDIQNSLSRLGALPKDVSSCPSGVAVPNTCLDICFDSVPQLLWPAGHGYQRLC